MPINVQLSLPISIFMSVLCICVCVFFTVDLVSEINEDDDDNDKTSVYRAFLEACSFGIMVCCLTNRLASDPLTH